MNNTTNLVVGYVFVTVLYGAYWISLRMKLSKLERIVRKAK